MRKLCVYALFILALLLVMAGAFHGFQQEESSQPEGSSAAVGLMLLEKEQGLYVLAVIQGSPADKAGVQPGDYIVSSEEVKLKEMAQLDALLEGLQATIPLTIQKRDATVEEIRLPIR